MTLKCAHRTVLVLHLILVRVKKGTMESTVKYIIVANIFTTHPMCALRMVLV